MILHDCAANLLTFISGALTTWGRPAVPRRLVSWGPPVHDLGEGCDAQLATWLVDVAAGPTQVVPEPGSIAQRFQPDGWKPPAIVRIGFDLARCAPLGTVLGDGGRELPSPLALTNAAATLADDLWVLHHAIGAATAEDLFGAAADGCDAVVKGPIVPVEYRGGAYGLVGDVGLSIDAGPPALP